MIHSSKRIASYVYLRGDVYYFQIRLRKDDARHSQFRSSLIRKSLKTGIHREAVHKARLLWLEYMTNSKRPNLRMLDGMDQSAQYHADLYIHQLICSYSWGDFWFLKDAIL